ncbi:MAG: CpaF/VirB11 family protein [Bacilli bacterium]|nr:CpaF/VirB11 family protein [Bacilli bacterium]
MDVEKAIKFLEASFIAPLFHKPDITDISYNGNQIFYLSNIYGRQVSDIEVSRDQVKDFLRQIANIAEKQFSYQTPYLDVSIGKYRINAVHQSIGRVGNEEALTFSIRIGGEKGLINDQSSFLNPELITLFECLIDEGIPMVIGGITGCGKTEFQKYLISKMNDNTRIIVIDNVLELTNITNSERLDINTWQVDEKNHESNIQNLVRNALRSNPDWLIVAESRGAEMLEILNSAMTGHPIITTIHATQVKSMPSRIGRMIMMNDKKMDYENVMQDVYSHFHIYIYLKRRIDKSGEVSRYISDVCYLDDKGELTSIYKNNLKVIEINELPEALLETFDERNIKRLEEMYK